jgi:HSP20 family protein
MYESFLTSPAGLLAEFDRFQREFENAFGGIGRPTSIRAVARGSYPAINVGSTPNSIEIYAFAPGLSRDKIEVSVEKGLLTMAGERVADSGAAGNGAGTGARDQRRSVYANERFSGRWKRVVSLPDDADPQGVDASYRDGLLHVSVKRRESAQPQRIPIQ